jgi:hypothetical protein
LTTTTRPVVATTTKPVTTTTGGAATTTTTTPLPTGGPGTGGTPPTGPNWPLSVGLALVLLGTAGATGSSWRRRRWTS